MNLDGPLPRLVQNWSIFRDGNLNYLLIADWVACYMVVVYSVVPFVFRYLIVVKNYRMSKLQFFGLLLFAFSYCLTISVAITSLSAATHFDNMASMPIPNASCTRFLPQFNANNINTPLRVIQFRAWVYIGQVFQCLYVIIFFCMASIWWFLRKQSALMSSQNKSIQWQISLVIGLHLTLDWGPYWQSIYYYLLFTSYSLVPFLNPLIPMLFVARYRQAIVGAFYSVVTKTPGMSHWGQSASVQTIDLTSGNHT
ncbi:hypothetical protein M3Y99_00727300 [Aphelenchoides fujianensis]|nr:hypothetical protein M3Y99_00727300 [Aphelenchoides fujianensis]